MNSELNRARSREGAIGFHFSFRRSHPEGALVGTHADSRYGSVDLRQPYPSAGARPRIVNIGNVAFHGVNIEKHRRRGPNRRARSSGGARPKGHGSITRARRRRTYYIFFYKGGRTPLSIGRTLDTYMPDSGMYVSIRQNGQL